MHKGELLAGGTATKVGALMAILLSVIQSEQALATCPRVELSGEVSRGSGFERDVGKEFVFRLNFTPNDPTGWEIEMYPRGDLTPEHELSRVVTIPYRSWNGRYIMPGWGMSARQAVAADHEFQFLGKPQEFDYVDALVKTYLWPHTYSEDKVEKATAELYRVLEGDSRIAVCTGRLTILASRVVDSVIFGRNLRTR